jgi:hypothetical protein
MAHEDLESRLAGLEAFRDICNLQGRYNHYLATGQLPGKLPELFAMKTPGLKAEMADSGLWQGPDGVGKLFQHLGTKYHMKGGLFVHMLLTPVLEVSRDCTRAHGMWNSLGANTYMTDSGALEAMWQAGKYDNVFVKEDGKWKFLEFKWYVIFRTPYQDGWVKQPIVEGLHEAGFPPVSSIYNPYNPAEDNVFLPFPPEPGS